MPFKSKAQQRFMFAAEARGEIPKGTARRWAHETPNIKSLPERVGKKKKKASILDYLKKAGTKKTSPDNYIQPTLFILLSGAIPQLKTAATNVENRLGQPSTLPLPGGPKSTSGIIKEKGTHLPLPGGPKSTSGIIGEKGTLLPLPARRRSPSEIIKETDTSYENWMVPEHIREMVEKAFREHNFQGFQVEMPTADMIEKMKKLEAIKTKKRLQQTPGNVPNTSPKTQQTNLWI